MRYYRRLIAGIIVVLLLFTAVSCNQAETPTPTKPVAQTTETLESETSESPKVALPVETPAAELVVKPWEIDAKQSQRVEALLAYLAFAPEFFNSSENLQMGSDRFDRFALIDLDTDGVEELLFYNYDAIMARKQCLTYYYNFETKQVERFGLMSAAFDAYSTGYVNMKALHNHSAGLAVWPGTLTQMDREQGVFRPIFHMGSIDLEIAGHSHYDPEDRYDPDKDLDNDGIIHWIQELDPEGPRQLMTQAEFDAYTAAYMPPDKKLLVDFLPYSPEVLQREIMARLPLASILQIDSSKSPEISIYLADRSQNQRLSLRPEDWQVTLALWQATGHTTIDYPLEPLELRSAEEAAKKISLLIDPASGLPVGLNLDQYKQQLKASIEAYLKTHPRDEIELIICSERPQLLQSMTGDVTLLLEAIDGLSIPSESGLASALAMAYYRLVGAAGPKNIVVLSESYYLSSGNDEILGLISRQFEVAIPIILCWSHQESPASELSSITRISRGGVVHLPVDEFDSFLQAALADYAGAIEYRVKLPAELGEQRYQLMVKYRLQPENIPELADDQIFQPHRAQSLISAQEGNFSALSETDKKQHDASAVDYLLANYLNSFIEALRQNDYAPLKPWVVADSGMEKEQRDYVQNKYQEELLSYEILDVSFSGDDQALLKTREVYSFASENTPLKLLVQRCSYQLRLEDDGWKMEDFAEPVQLESRFGD